MAEFLDAYYKTNQIEGGYANDPDDKGGETYRGIARKFHPNWLGWKIIDGEKGNSNFPKSLDNIKQLQDGVKYFYFKEFWNKIGGDPIPDQAIANEVYDNAVNMGVPQSIKYLQRTINILNRNQKNYPDIEVDGGIGPKTSAAFEACYNEHGPKMILSVINGFQMKHYLELMEKDPINEKYIGWFKRVEIKWI